jgi:oligopeptide transport system substrate-binding protein
MSLFFALNPTLCLNISLKLFVNPLHLVEIASLTIMGRILFSASGRRWCQWILTIALVGLFVGCRHDREEDDGYFRYNQIGGLETLDPAFAKNLAIMWAVHNIYNTLVEVDTALRIVPSLAHSWQISDDGLRYTFQLRKDVYFHDNPAFPEGKGRRMVAQDVVYSFNRLIDPQTASAGAWVFNGRVRDQQPFEAPNDSTFIVHLAAPFRPLVEILSMPYCSIVPKEAAEYWGKDFRNHPCGTGPFYFQFWDEGNVLTLRRNERYWERDATGAPLPYLAGVKVSFHETRSMEFLLLKQGKLDFINGIDGSMKDLILTKKGALRAEQHKELVLSKHVYLNTEYLGITLDTTNEANKLSPLKHRALRQAISYAIDRQKIVTYFRNGVGLPATKGFIPSGMPGTERRVVEGYEYNPAKAMQLLRQAGFPEGKGLPIIVLNCPDANVDICNFIAGQLNDIGLRVKVQVLQPGLLRQMMSKSQTPFFKAQWIADYPDAETYLAFFFSELPAPPNYTRFNNATFDRWYRTSLQTTDDSLRFLLYAQMDSLISAEAPVIPLFYDELLHFTRKNITGMRRNALNMIDLRYVRKESQK